MQSFSETDYKTRFKPITQPPKTPDKVQVRDTFETPRYATELLLPFIPKDLDTIWECAVGNGMISKVLKENHYFVFGTDIRNNKDYVDLIWNFIEDGNVEEEFYLGNFCIISNPPFSIKEKFIEQAFVYRFPFAFLINADYSQQQINWIRRGCEKIIPNRRIDFLTPNIVSRINKDLGTEYKTREEIEDELLAKYSSSQSHSMWLTYGFNIGRTEAFVDLPIEWKKTKIK